MKFYRLKSNRNTIVKKDGNYHQIVWSKSMESGYDSRWMIHRWNINNVELLDIKETKVILAKIKEFDIWKAESEKQFMTHRRRK